MSKFDLLWNKNIIFYICIHKPEQSCGTNKGKRKIENEYLKFMVMSAAAISLKSCIKRFGPTVEGILILSGDVYSVI